jgi:hypothetical protein
MLARINFMTAGEAYEVELPDSTDPVPESTAAFAIGGLTRELIFEPAAQRRDPDADPLLMPLFSGTAHGRPVSAYRVRQSPPLLAAFWRLQTGYLHTYIDSLVAPRKGCDTADLGSMLKDIVQHVAVSDTPHGPFVAISAPLAPGDQREQPQRDSVRFTVHGPAGDASELTFRREPPWAREGKSVRRNENEVAEVGVTTPMQVAVTARGHRDAVDALDGFASSAAESLVRLH